MPPSQQGQTGRRALRLGCVVGQPESLPGEGIDPAGPRPPERPPAVTAQLPETQVVHVEEQDVRPLSHASTLLLQAAGQQSCVIGEAVPMGTELSDSQAPHSPLPRAIRMAEALATEILAAGSCRTRRGGSPPAEDARRVGGEYLTLDDEVSVPRPAVQPQRIDSAARKETVVS